MKKHKNWVFIVFSVIVLIFQSPISMSNLPWYFTSIVKNYDEILSLVLFIFVFLRFIRKGIPKGYINEIVMFFLFLLIGLLGTLINRLQPINAVIEDIINCSKFFVTFLGISILYKSSSRKVLDALQKISAILIVFLFALTIIDMVMPNLLFTNTYIRYGIHAVHLFYYHPAVLSQVIALLLSIISIESIYLNHIIVYKVMAIIILASTLRSKAFGFICLYLFIWILNKIDTRPFRILLFILAIMMVVFISFDSISLYYGGQSSARATLTIDSLTIANNNIPIGLGFGTFGSASAAKYYSPVYEALGYKTRYGMGYVNDDYLTDSFWPVILGEFGYTGLLAYIGIIAFLMKKSIFLFKKNSKLGLAAISIMGYLLISSTAATAFFNPISVPNGIVLALIFNVFMSTKKNSGVLNNGIKSKTE